MDFKQTNRIKLLTENKIIMYEEFNHVYYFFNFTKPLKGSFQLGAVQ